jgi:hypothetical protein
MRSSSSPSISKRSPVGACRRRLRAPFAFRAPAFRAPALPLPPALIAAYSATTYAVDGQPDWALRVGAACPALSQTLLAQGLTRAAYLSAWNAAGRRLPAVVNVAAQARLSARVAASGLRAYTGWGRGDSTGWPPERSLLILGLDPSDARLLARDFGQRAWIAFEAGGVAEIAPTWP